MQERQDRYGELMKPFGLSRGQKSTGIKHENAREYYGRMQKALEEGSGQAEIGVNNTILGAGKDRKISELLIKYR